jgi:hypothetical protein
LEQGTEPSKQQSTIIRLLRLGLVPAHARIAIQALVELARVGQSDAALHKRARLAVAAALGECGIQTQLDPPPLALDFRPPGPEELQRLLALSSLAFPLPTPTPVPRTPRAAPDRHPYDSAPLCTCADLSAKAGQDAAIWAAAGVKCRWFAEPDDRRADLARANIASACTRLPPLLQLDPSAVSAACLLFANLSSTPFGLAGLRMTTGEDAESAELIAFLHAIAVARPKAAVLINLPQLATAAGGKIAQLTVDLATEAGFRAQVHILSAIEFRVPVDTQRSVVFFVREDYACKWGMPARPKAQPSPEGGLDALLQPADDMTHLWLQTEVTWSRNPDAPLPAHLAGKPTIVGFVGSSNVAEARVYMHAVPATRRDPRGPGGRSHLVAQKSAGLGRWIVRPMSPSELSRLVHQWDPTRPRSPRAPGEDPDPELASADGALATPGNLMAAITQTITSFFQPITTFRPASLADIGLTPQVLQQWQGSMRVGHLDHMRMRRNRTCDTGDGLPAVPAGERPKPHGRRMDPTAACFPVAAPRAARKVLWYVADAVAAGDAKLIVPVQQWRAVSSHINADLIRQMARGFADKEIVDMLVLGTNPKNDPFTNQAALLPNAKSAEIGWYYVNKAFAEDLKLGLAVKFDTKHSPPFWPLLTHPSGAVEKTDAQGVALKDERRPTSDLSFKGSAVHDVIAAPNDSIDLNDPGQFPTLRYFSVPLLARKAIVLSLSGVPVRVAAWDMARYYKQFFAQMVTVPSHCRYWSDEAGPAIIASLTMLFGCKAAACLASRASALLAYWLQLVMDLLPPAHPKARRWQDLQTWASERRTEGDPRFANFKPFYSTASCDWYIDDFPLLCLDGQQENILKAFAALMQVTGIAPQPKKVLPEGEFTFLKKILGVWLDTSVTPFELRIPEDKILKARTRIGRVLGREFIECEPMQELVGILNWIGSILIKSGCRLPFAITTLKATLRNGRARVSRELEEELRWWLELLAKWNRRAVVLEPAWTIPAHSADRAPFTDASRSERAGGAGGVFHQYFFAWTWSREELSELNIMELEGMAHVLWLNWICHHLPHMVAGKRFISRCDNMGFVGAAKKGRSTVPSIAFLLNKLHELQALFSFEIQLVFVSSEDNVAADAASRQQWERFFQFMLANTNFSRAHLTQVHDVPLRSDWSSRMRQLKSSASGTLQPQ